MINWLCLWATLWGWGRKPHETWAFCCIMLALATFACCRRLLYRFYLLPLALLYKPAPKSWNWCCLLVLQALSSSTTLKLRVICLFLFSAAPKSWRGIGAAHWFCSSIKIASTTYCFVFMFSCAQELAWHWCCTLVLQSLSSSTSSKLRVICLFLFSAAPKSWRGIGAANEDWGELNTGVWWALMIACIHVLERA